MQRSVLVFDGHFHNRVVDVKLSFKEWLQLRLFGCVYVFDAKKGGWNGMLPFFVARCSKHGLYLDYGHGVDKVPRCIRCTAEFAKLIQVERITVEQELEAVAV